MTLDGSIMRGDIVGADFDTLPDGRILVHVAVDADYAVSRRRVALVDADEFERMLPTADEVHGILGRET